MATTTTTASNIIGMLMTLEQQWQEDLPFDLAAANSGDEVEMYSANRQTWIELKGAFKKSRDLKYVVFVNKNNTNLIKKSDLRMKHPRRVGVDYSQFESEMR